MIDEALRMCAIEGKGISFVQPDYIKIFIK